MKYLGLGLIGGGLGILIASATFSNIDNKIRNKYYRIGGITLIIGMMLYFIKK